MILLVFLLIPLISGLIVLMFRKAATIRYITLTSALISLAMTLLIIVNFPYAECSVHRAGILGVWFSLGSDGISLVMLLLTNLIFPFIFLAGWNRDQNHPSALHALMLFTQFALTGVFIARSAFVFYIFWELALIPVYFLLLLWGGRDRKFITLKFFIYTLTGSLFLLFGIIYLYLQTPGMHSTDFSAFSGLNLPVQTQKWLFWILFIGFAIKMPLFPFHTWQPSTYTMASTQGTMILAAVLSKMGIYGALKLLFPIVPLGVDFWKNTVIILGLTGVIYASVIAFRQSNLKKLIAWSSLAHISLMAASLFVWNSYALQGVLFQVLAHGITIVALFYVVSLIEEKTGAWDLTEMGGLKIKMPNLAVLFLIIVLGSVALPFTAGFIGEIFMITGLFKLSLWFAFFGSTTMVLGAIYMFYAYQRSMLGEINPVFAHISDISTLDYFILVPLVILILGLGIFPQPVFNLINDTVNSIPDLLKPVAYSGAGI
jgi:NADH-quinone oxidoreductase subunit M